MYKFAPASKREQTVFGAARPSFSDQNVADWIEFMKRQRIQRICCLLPESQLAPYSNLIATYQQEFEPSHVCWSPITDFQLCDRVALTQVILPFLSKADQSSERVVVHCSGGVGCTGQVLAAWLIYGRGFSKQEAIAAVKKSGRNPYEAAIAAALKGRNPLKVVKDLDALLDHCRLE